MISRSQNMARIRGKGTKPEMQVRRLVHGLGYRYRLHRADLPGRPDLVFSSRRKVIFVNGCFWHQHPGCKRAGIPSTSRDFWIRKLTGNQARDDRNTSLLEIAGWKVLTVWQCQLKDQEALTDRLVAFLSALPASPCGHS